MNSEGTRFSVIPKRSIEVYAETIGILGRNIGDDVAESLSEDATYRIREALQNAIRFMKHSKRRHLTVEDFNKGLKWANVEQVYGHGGMELPHFKSLSPKDTNLQVFYIEEKEINLRELSLDLSLPPDSGDVSVKGMHSRYYGTFQLMSRGPFNNILDIFAEVVCHFNGPRTFHPQRGTLFQLFPHLAQWLVFEGITCPGGKLGKEEISWAKERLDEPYLLYLETLVAAIFGKHKTAQQRALLSLRELPQLQVVLPNLISFLVVKIKAADENRELYLIAEQTLAIIRAIVENTSLFLNPYVLQIVKLLLFIIMEGYLDVPYWHFKKYASNVVATVCRRYMATMQHLPHQLLKAFQDCCMDSKRSVASVYGAVVGLHSLGAEAIFQVLCPSMKLKIDLVMETLSESDSLDPSQCNSAMLLYGALKEAATSLIKKYASNSNMKNNSSLNQSQAPRNLCSLYTEFVDEFGDGIVGDCLYYGMLVNGRGNHLPGRNFKLSGLNRESETLRNMIQTYLDGMKSKASDSVETKGETVYTRFERTEFSSQTSCGKIQGFLCRKRPANENPSYEKHFTSLLAHSSAKRQRVDDEKQKMSNPLPKRMIRPSRSNHTLLYDISKVSLLVDMVL